MPISFDKPTVIEAMKFAGTAIGTLIAAASMFWWVGEPHAESWFNEKLRKAGVAHQSQVNELQRKLGDNQSIAQEVRDRTLRLEARQETMLNSQARTQQLLETLLLELRRRDP